jgi:hypothetical protein
MPKRKGIYAALSFLPMAGIGIFVVLYIMAAVFYPGGNQMNISEKGFSIINNYWCDLFGLQGKNGINNPGRPFAITAMFVIALSLSAFWIVLPKVLKLPLILQHGISFFGIAAMAIVSFLFTAWHNEVVIAAGLCGGAAMVIVLYGLYYSGFLSFFYVGILCIVLMFVNYYILSQTDLLSYLPLVQKISFAIMLTWLFLLSRKTYRVFSKGV